LNNIPGELRDAVEGGDVGYAIFDGPGHRQLAFGSRVPGTETLVYVYFAYSMEGVDQTLELLWQVLVGVVAAAAVIAGAVGWRLADRTTRPLRAAADAARKVAEGGLDTRLSEEGDDELARLAADFNRMTHALERRIARELQFVSDVSHELRTPLTTLKTSIDYIAERVEGLPPRLSQAVGLAADEVRALSRLVNDLLELTRAEAGGIHVSSDEVDLRDFATEIVRRRAPETDVDIEGPEHLIVRTDKSRLERVVGNLVENAVMHGGGQQVRIKLDRSNGAATITVADNGPGISAEEISHIFDRFWRGDRARQRDGKVGAGLGMSIAKENARLIGAELKVDSAPGQGTRFHVVLPRRAE
jgi:two-component system sensor histidine kinase MtrB